MIHNPILPGFNPDPCLCRKGEDYYLVEADPTAMGEGMSEKQTELYTLRAGDEVVVTAKDLYNGKVIG